jgi:hypothetical protein
MERLFLVYCRCFDRGYCRGNGRGYTYDPTQAGRFTEAEARRITDCSRCSERDGQADEMLPAPETVVMDFNAAHPVGTTVTAWPGVRGDGTGFVTTTKTAATLLQGHTPVVWVKDYSACIALSHIEPVAEDA